MYIGPTPHEAPTKGESSVHSPCPQLVTHFTGGATEERPGEGEELGSEGPPQGGTSRGSLPLTQAIFYWGQLSLTGLADPGPRCALGSWEGSWRRG